MPQVFHPATNAFAKVSILGAGAILAIAVYIMMIVVRSPYTTMVHVVREQPVAFSHEHHVSHLGIDCRYCHLSVEDSSSAGIPATEICMNCHSYLFVDSPMLEPVRTSYRTGVPLQWTRVHDVPDFVYFNHSIHVHAGIGCDACHGRVDKMPLMWREKTLHMQWCLECHREPEKYIRPREEVFNLGWTPEGDQEALAEELIQLYAVERKTDCSTCHR